MEETIDQIRKKRETFFENNEDNQDNANKVVDIRKKKNIFNQIKDKKISAKTVAKKKTIELELEDINIPKEYFGIKITDIVRKINFNKN